jgi:hypothetical protein
LTATTRTLSSDPPPTQISKEAFFQRPVYIFYYPDVAISSKRWDELASTLEREGFSGISDFMSEDPREEGFISNMDLLLAERLNRLFQ